MKKGIFVLLTLILLLNIGFSQTIMSWRLGPMFENFNNLKVYTANNQFHSLNSLAGTDLDLNVVVGKIIGQAGVKMGFNTKSKDQILTNLNSFSGNLFFGKAVVLNDNYTANFLLGYTCQTLQISGYKKEEQDFATLTINNSKGVLQLQNMAHCVSVKVENNFIDNRFILAVSYNYGLTNNKWKQLYGNLANAPSDKLTSFEVSLKYSILSKKW